MLKRICPLLLTLVLFFKGVYLYSDTLYGKNFYIPHLLNYSFPGFDPMPGKVGETCISTAYYGVNEFLSYNSESIAMDYESSVLEFSYTYRPLDRLLLGIDFRFVSYYGGFMDPLIELWHKVFSFPNGERHFFEQNSNYIILESDGFKDVELNDPAVSFGDIDLYSLLSIYNKDFSLALASVIKLPTGNINYFSGSGTTDLGFQFLGNIDISQNFSLDLQQGVVIPLNVIDLKSEGYSKYVQFQTLFAATYKLSSKWRVINQFKIHTSPISYDRYKTTDALGIMVLYTLPQFSIQIGLKRTVYPWTFQFYIEEDPFTYEGVDILINLRVSRRF